MEKGEPNPGISILKGFIVWESESLMQESSISSSEIMMAAENHYHIFEN